MSKSPTPVSIKPVVSFVPPFDVSGLPERPLPARANGRSNEELVAAPGMDLSGRAKTWFVIGRGRVGKTTLIRVIAETLAAQGGEAVYAAADPVNRSLKAFLSPVAEPPSDDPGEVAVWLQGLAAYVMKGNSALVDLGGGDTSLSRLLRIWPSMAEDMERSDSAPIAIHLIGPDEHDLVPLAAMEGEEGERFTPKATALMFNEALGSRPEFARVLQHSVVRKAIARGAVPIWFPKLSPAAIRLVDAHGIRFAQAGEELGLLAGAPVRVWLEAIAREFAPIASWMP